MKQTVLIIFAILFSYIVSIGQIYKAVTVIEKSEYYLNGGARANLGGKSRETIKIDLPENTIKWYYSFTTSASPNGTNPLNLSTQITDLLKISGYTALSNATLNVADGESMVDASIIPIENNTAFLNHEDINSYNKVSLGNVKQAVQSVENNYGNSFYIGIRNPSALLGEKVFLEVVAITKDGNTELDKGVLYGDLGLKAFAKGDYDKSLELSNKALSFNPNLTKVKFNIALTHLAQEKGEAIDEYVELLTNVKKEDNTKKLLSEVLKQLKNQKSKTPHLKNISEVIDLVNKEYKKH